MTENEAIERIKSGICNEIGTAKYCHDNCMHGVEHCAYSMAINALEEIQAYRAIGTTPTRILELVGGLNIELSKYAEIGTIDEFKDLKEKSMAKKPQECEEVYDNILDEYVTTHVCVCGSLVFKPQLHCEMCGQKLDWSE